MEEIPNINNIETRDIKPEKKGWSAREKILLGIAVILFLLCAGLVSYYFLTKDPGTLLGPTQDPQEENNIDEQEDTNPANSEGAGGSQVKGVIKGILSYPGEMIPAMKVCAVSKTDEQEICVDTKNGEDTFEISVPVGTYLIYSAVNNHKAYYTECDTYTEPTTDPRCNSNFDNKAGSWNDEGFVCYQDSACKAAYTPLGIEVKEDETIQLKRLINGWYIPCSHDTTTCNSESFDVWQDYL